MATVCSRNENEYPGESYNKIQGKYFGFERRKKIKNKRKIKNKKYSQ